MARSLVWLSFDLGLAGDYDSLYLWLDKHEAKECGDNVASFWYEHRGDVVEAVKRDISRNFVVTPKTRMYLIRSENGKTLGRFIFGSRRSAHGPGWPLAATRARIPLMPSLRSTILADTGFWFALYRPGDDHHVAAVQRESILAKATVLVPWPSLYETFNTRFSKNRPAVEQFESFIYGPHAKLLDDAPYRQEALKMSFSSGDRRWFSLVDLVIRLILDDRSVPKDAILTFNPGDFADLCRKHRIEML